MEKVKAIVLFANPWRIEERTGIVREGISIEYIISDNLLSVANEDGSLGYRVVKESININNAKQIVKVPGIYEITYGFTVKKGKPVFKINSINYVSEVCV